MHIVFIKSMLVYLSLHHLVLICRVFILYTNSGSTSFWRFSRDMGFVKSQKVFNPFFYKIDLEELVEYRELAKWINKIQLALLVFDILLVVVGFGLMKMFLESK